MSAPQEILGGAVIIVIIGFLVSAKPASSLSNKVVVPQTTPSYHWWRGPDDGDGTYSFRGDLNGRVGRYVVRHSVLHQPKPGSPDEIPTLSAEFSPDRYFGEWNYDFGTFGAYRRASTGTSTDAFQVGLRFSPARLAFGTVAPDLVLSKDCVGAGLSVFVPEEYSGQFAHFGLGAWYTIPLAGTSRAGRPGWDLGLSFSTQPSR